jgi:glycosyltransferase involved in cell wall biosynthesis
MIPVHNCAKYLAQTLESVLQQDPGIEQMQIEIVDDFSNDNPEQIVNEIGKGRVGYYRQEKNVGHTKNFETCLQRSKGILVHQLHGDDYVLPGFYKEMEDLFSQNPSLGAGFCQTFLVNENNQYTGLSNLVQKEKGILPNFINKLAYRQQIFTPGIVVKRAVYEDLGGFDERLKWCEDWEMWVRISQKYDLGYLPIPLACYREHESSNTAKYAKNATKLRDFVEGIKMVNTYLPEQKRKAHLKDVLNYYGETWVIYEIEKALQAGDKETAKANLKLANAMIYAPSVKLRLLKLWLKILNA